MYEVATHFCVCAQTLEDRPVPWSGRHDRRVRLLEQYTAEVEGVSPRARTRKDPRVGADSHEVREHLRSDSIRRWSIDDRFQPEPVLRVIVRICPECVDQDIDVRKNQPQPSIRSRSEEVSFRSTPGKVPPPARHSGNVTGRRPERFMGCRSTSSSPSSIREVRVVLRLAASARARSSRASSSRTVVLICHGISCMSVCPDKLGDTDRGAGPGTVCC